MKAGHTVWRTGPNQFLSADIDGFRLVVQGPEHAGEPARFHVMRHEAGGHRTIGAGTEPDVRAAMAAAEQMAKKFAGRRSEDD